MVKNGSVQHGPSIIRLDPHPYRACLNSTKQCMIVVDGRGFIENHQKPSGMATNT